MFIARVLISILGIAFTGNALANEVADEILRQELLLASAVTMFAEEAARPPFDVAELVQYQYISRADIKIPLSVSPNGWFIESNGDIHLVLNDGDLCFEMADAPNSRFRCDTTRGSFELIDDLSKSLIYGTWSVKPNAVPQK